MMPANQTRTGPALLLYNGKVMHARMKPVQHRFTYGVCSILIDIDRLEAARRQSPLFSVNRWNLVSFRERDHGKRDGASLRAFVNASLAAVGMAAPERVELLCYPSVLGFTFNPLSVYFCYDAGVVTSLIYQVSNTFGESHCYVEPVMPGQSSESGIRQDREKSFYVSPFLEMAMTYHFRIKPPQEEVAIRILETDSDGPILSATFHGNRQVATTGSLLLAVAKTAGIAWKVMVGIHFEALRLWLKGLKLQDRPHKPATGGGISKPGAHSNGLAAGEQ